MGDFFSEKDIPSKIMQGVTPALYLARTHAKALQLPCGAYCMNDDKACVDEANIPPYASPNEALWLLFLYSMLRAVFGIVFFLLRFAVDALARKAEPRTATRCENVFIRCATFYFVFHGRVIAPIWWVFLYLWFGGLVMEEYEEPWESRAHYEYQTLMNCIRNNTDVAMYDALMTGLPPPDAYPWRLWDWCRASGAKLASLSFLPHLALL